MQRLRKLVLGLALLVISCDREMLDEKTLSIENGLDTEVSVRFYNRGQPVADIGEAVNDARILFKRTLRLQGVVTVTDVYGADSLLIIFNGTDFETHTSDNQPRGNSLFNLENYIPQGENTRLYAIDERNLDNAVPCNGSCD